MALLNWYYNNYYPVQTWTAKVVKRVVFQSVSVCLFGYTKIRIMSKIGYSIRSLLAMYESEIELWSTSRARASFKDLKQQARFRANL